MNKAVILQGSNLGEREKFLTLSLNLIEKKIGRIIEKSTIIESEPWGFNSQQWFLNRVLIIETKDEPIILLEKLKNIETLLGREQNNTNQYQSRVIDLDILYFNNQIIEISNLTIPHAHLQDRVFTLIPLCEILPDYFHPKLLKTNSELLENCHDNTIVIPWNVHKH